MADRAHLALSNSSWHSYFHKLYRETDKKEYRHTPFMKKFNSTRLLERLRIPFYLHTVMTQMYDYLEAKMIKLIPHILKIRLRHILVTISSAPVIFICIMIAWGNPGTRAQRCTNSKGKVVPVRYSTLTLLKHGWHRSCG